MSRILGTAASVSGSIGQGKGRPTRRRALRIGAATFGIVASATPAGCAVSGTTPRGGDASGAVAPPAQLRQGATITWAVDSTPATRKALRDDQVQLFRQQFPEMKVEYLEGATGTEKLQTLFAAGTPPDLFRQETAGMAHFASFGQAATLDPLIARDKYDLSDFFPAAWELWKWKGQRYGVPFMGIRIAYYNRALGQGAGARRPPAGWKDASWTFDAFLEAARKVRGSGEARWGADLGADRRDWQPWVWNNGGELFDAGGTRLLLEEPAAIEALQFLVDLIHKHRVAPPAAELAAQGGRRAVFEGGNLFLYHEPVNSIATNRRAQALDWSVTALPRGKARSTASSGGGVGWFLATASKTRDETWELMKLLASKESVRLEAVRGEAPPSRRSVANEPAFSSPSEPPAADMKVVVEALEALHLETALLQGIEIDRILGEDLAPMWRGERTVREAVGQAAGRIRPLLNPPG